MTHRRRSSGRRRGVLTALLAAPLLVVPLTAVPSSSAEAPRVRWSDTSVRVGKAVTATVTKGSRPAGTDLVLQRRFPDAWRPADRSARRTPKGFVLRVPSGQFGSFTYRVVAKDGGRIVSSSAHRSVTVRPGYQPVGKARQHAFGQDPRVRWDSCRTITWKFNPRHAPTGGLGQVKEGVKRIRQATGLEFDYAGKTTQKPNAHGQGIRGAAVIVGWLPPRSYQVFRQSPSTVGHGGYSYRTTPMRAGNGTAAYRAFQGGVVLNIKHDRALRNDYGKGYTWGEVIIHELGHVVGLAHPDGSRQIMHATVIPRNATWGAGDIAGFRKVGDAAGCLRPAPGRSSSELRTWSAR
jgi:hypothetical protein